MIPLLDVVGSDGGVLFWQTGPIWLNVGATCDVMVILNVAGSAQIPGVGVNVYVDVPGVDVLIVAGLHLPVMPLLEVTGNVGAVEFWHNGPIGEKVGLSLGVIVTFTTNVLAH